MALTDIAIRNEKPKEKPYKLTDGGGLFLWVQPTGRKWWRYPTKRMLKQCELEGKQPSVTSNIVNHGAYSGDPYSVILFKCI